MRSAISMNMNFPSSIFFISSGETVGMADPTVKGKGDWVVGEEPSSTLMKDFGNISLC